MSDYYLLFTILAAFTWTVKRAHDRRDTSFNGFLMLLRDFTLFPFVVLWEELKQD